MDLGLIYTPGNYITCNSSAPRVASDSLLRWIERGQPLSDEGDRGKRRASSFLPTISWAEVLMKGGPGRSIIILMRGECGVQGSVGPGP